MDDLMLTVLSDDALDALIEDLAVEIVSAEVEAALREIKQERDES